MRERKGVGGKTRRKRNRKGLKLQNRAKQAFAEQVRGAATLGPLYMSLGRSSTSSPLSSSSSKGLYGFFSLHRWRETSHRNPHQHSHAKDCPQAAGTGGTMVHRVSYEHVPEGNLAAVGPAVGAPLQLTALHTPHVTLNTTSKVPVCNFYFIFCHNVCTFMETNEQTNTHLQRQKLKSFKSYSVIIDKQRKKTFLTRILWFSVVELFGSFSSHNK